MIYITIEVHPHGSVFKSKRIASGVIHNDGTGTKNEGNYKVVLNGTRTVGKYTTTVRGFKRERDDVWRLLYLALKGIFDED